MTTNTTPTISHTRFAIQTAFGIGRTTIYLLAPAIGAVMISNSLDNQENSLLKVGIFLMAIVISWILIGLDYYFLMKKIKITTPAVTTTDEHDNV
jgi:hypothetical protein